MKKILLVMMAAFAFATVSFAQETAVKTSKVFDNTFVSLNGGASWCAGNSTFAEIKDVNPLAQFAFGKYFTPVVGNQLFIEAGAKEESGAKTFVEHIAFGSDMLFNLNNLFAGYNGKPRVFELVYQLGVGAFHSMDGVALRNTDKTWSAIARTGLQFNFNLGSARAWQINVVPGWTWQIRNSMRGINDSYVTLLAGVTYKFKNHYGTHNFVLAKLLNEDEWNRLNEDVNSLRKENDRLTRTVDTQAATIKELTERLNRLNGTLKLDNVVNFKIGSSTVEPLQMGNLAKVADALNANKDAKVTVRGYADAQTGSAEFNQKLSEQRAQAVKDLLVNTFNVNSDQVETEGLGSTQQVFNQNDWNRVAIFVTK